MLSAPHTRALLDCVRVLPLQVAEWLQATPVFKDLEAIKCHKLAQLLTPKVVATCTEALFA